MIDSIEKLLYMCLIPILSLGFVVSFINSNVIYSLTFAFLIIIPLFFKKIAK